MEKKPLKNHSLLAFKAVTALSALILGYLFLFGAPRLDGSAHESHFIVQEGMTQAEIAAKLQREGYVRNTFISSLLFTLKIGTLGETYAGAYRISKNMNVWEIVNTFLLPPYMKWVKISPGLRKEQVANLMAKELGWDEEKKEQFISAPKKLEKNLEEGIYYPDIYLLPVSESGTKIAERMFDRFEDRFKIYEDKLQAGDLSKEEVLTFASIIQREAAGSEDMPIIAGILWNRLTKDMRLEIDATIQYARGSEELGWWPRLRPKDKDMYSPFNTYRYKGFPPHPIANPSLTALEAVLKPAKTNCLFYLHDDSRQFHCSKTYAEHIQNIERYF